MKSEQPAIYTKLEKLLNYKFDDPALLDEALRHRSYVNEQNDTLLSDNEKLEFLGDAVINLAVGHLLMIKYPHFKEGDLSRTRASLVNENQLAEIARQIKLGNFIKLGKGEKQSRGQEKDSILADALEALVAAVYLDGGFDTAFGVVRHLFQACLGKQVETRAVPDYKSHLQEIAQNQYHTIPRYRIVAEKGPAHARIFQAEVNVAGTHALGKGKSKKAAQQDAARQALDLLSAGLEKD